MRILMVARRYPPDVISGSETVFRELYQQASKRHEVRLVVGYSRSRELVPPEALGVDLRGQPAGRAHWLLWRAARAEIKRIKPDVVLSNSIEVPTRQRAGLLKGPIPTVCIVHDLNFGGETGRFGTLGREWLYRRQGQRLDRVVAVSEATRRHLVEQAHIPEDRVVVIHNGVDTERFRPVPQEERDTIEVCYPGRMLAPKGQHIAIDALARLRPDEKKHFHLTVVGAATDPIYVDQLRIQAYQQPVDVLTDVEDIVPYYQRADLVVFPTLMREGFGFTAVEAMACGKPVIYSDQPAIREATGEHGFPVPPDDADPIRAHLRAFRADPTPYREAGAAGRAFVESRYRWDRVWERYERVLRDVCA